MSALERGASPTTALWDARRQAQEKTVKMVKMGLHVFSPDWERAVPHGVLGARYSSSFTETTLTIAGTTKSMSFPVQTCTRVGDLREALADTCMISPEDLTFVVKQGCNYRKQMDIEEVGRKVTVKGIKDFKPQPYPWPHPIGVIGAGYNGIKTCCHYLKEGHENIVCFDRNNRVGGYCWITAANKTSKLQTEMGSFHVWWGPEYATSKECGGWPTKWEFWPKKERILEHFHLCAQDYGMLPHVHFRTNVSEMDIIGPKDDISRYYNLTVTPLDGGEPEMIPVSVMYNYPGSMTRNRIIEYPGEDTFDGHIGYGMNDDMPYDHLAGSGVAILGNGAFAVENVRTCCEYKAKMIYVVTRRKNLPSPRVACWFVHQGPVPTPGRLVLDMFKPMYSITPDMGDPWDYWAVHAPADRSRATIIQNSRFGIGDVTFLAVIWGRMEYVESTVKRLTRHTCHLASGRKLEDVQCMVKSLGLVGDFEVDRLHKMKELIGNWCSGDFRRVIQIDPLGMNAANFTTFSTGIGTYGSVRTNKYLHDFPKEFNRMAGLGLMNQLPRQKSDEKLERPAYVTDVKFQMAAGIIVSSMCPKLQVIDAVQGPYKYELYHRAHPTKKFLEVCQQDWDQYQATWKEEGFKHDYVPYPYTYDMVAEQIPKPREWPADCKGMAEQAGEGAAAAPAAAEGGEAAAAASPPKPTLRPLPKIPRVHDGLPTWADLPEDFRMKNKDKTKRVKAFARIYCFYGIGDSAGQWMRDFVNNGALWCEMAVYEYKGHGTREEEAFDQSYEERVEDAWEAMQPALEQQAKGGPAEGCPWAIYAHSAGCVMACSIAARARAEFGLEPTCVFLVDQAPPNTPFLTDEGYELMCKGVKPLESSFDWMSVWCPDIARTKGKAKLADQIYERWSYGMRILEDFYRTAEEGYHKFNCPLFVFCGLTHLQSPADIKRIHDQVAAKKPSKPRKGLPKVEDIQAVSIEEYQNWSKWTTSTCEFIPVVSPHHEIWYHIETDTKLWQRFLELSGVTPDLLK